MPIYGRGEGKSDAAGARRVGVKNNNRNSFSNLCDQSVPPHGQWTSAGAFGVRPLTNLSKNIWIRRLPPQVYEELHKAMKDLLMLTFRTVLGNHLSVYMCEKRYDNGIIGIIVNQASWGF